MLAEGKIALRVRDVGVRAAWRVLHPGRQHPHWHPWAQHRYAAARARGHEHPRALRTLGRAWCRIVWRCWQDRTPYDPARHRGLQQHITVSIPTPSGPPTSLLLSGCSAPPSPNRRPARPSAKRLTASRHPLYRSEVDTGRLPSFSRGYLSLHRLRRDIRVAARAAALPCRCSRATCCASAAVRAGRSPKPLMSCDVNRASRRLRAPAATEGDAGSGWEHVVFGPERAAQMPTRPTVLPRKPDPAPPRSMQRREYRSRLGVRSRRPLLLSAGGRRRSAAVAAAAG